MKLADSIAWSVFENHLAPVFADEGRGAKPVRLMVGLQYLEFAFDQSDKEVVAAWVENQYRQYFCGGVLSSTRPRSIRRR